MSTGIEWTDETWNPVTGCTKVSPGCDNCYAERITNRFGGKGAFDTVVLHPERLDAPIHWRKPRRVFVNSMSDLFHDDVDYVFLSKVFAVMALTPHHTYQVLTKRAGRMASVIGHRSMPGQVEIEIFNLTGEDRRIELPLPNVWLGVSVEDQKWANVRIPKLLETPAAVRFLSCEPLLGPVDLSRGPAFCLLPSRRPAIDWLIVGGESGPGARPMHPEWARSLRDQCVEAGVPFFFKQWGEWRPGAFEFLPDGRWFAEEPGTGVRAHERFTWAEGMCDVWRVGKKRAGRELDGRTWDEMPERVV